MNPSFHPLKVRSVRPETPEAVVVSFELPEDLRERFAFTQGQYLTLRREVDGQDLRRPYSICAGVDDGELRVGVRRVAGGAFSNWVHASLKAGDTVDVMVPQGRFFVPLLSEAKRHHLGIAAGSGITPILSILKTVLAREPGSRFTLVYANRRVQSTMFKEELEDLKDRHLTRLVIHHVLSGEPTESPLNTGRIDRRKLGEFLRTIVPAASVDHAYVCGPSTMNDEAEAALLAAGVPQDRVHVERFGIHGKQMGSDPNCSAGPKPEGGKQLGSDPNYWVTVVRDGMERVIPCSHEHPNVLASAAAAGVDLPYSCTSGVCGTCRARVVEGEMRMERNFALDGREVAAGFILTCQARAVTERVVLSFDER